MFQNSNTVCVAMSLALSLARQLADKRHGHAHALGIPKGCWRVAMPPNAGRNANLLNAPAAGRSADGPPKIPPGFCDRQPRFAGKMGDE